jgi:hypothetical protein
MTARRRTGLALLLLSACSGGEPTNVVAPPPDPCVVLRAEIDTVHGRFACRGDTECELAPGILPPGEPHAGADRGQGRYGLGGHDRSGEPCGTAIHRDGRAALDDVLRRFTAAGCGPVSRDGSTACVTSSHGARATCRAGSCEMGM